MTEKQDFLDKVEELLEKYPEYRFEAYGFLLSALHHTVGKMDKPRHISGEELLNGIRDYALEQFGPMARSVLNHWGIHETYDFGKIVFAMVEAGVLRKQPDDKIEDFKDVYDFEKAFDQSYRIEGD